MTRVDPPGLDVIGDVHGYGSRLKQLLGELGYREVHGAWRHPNRRAVFVGDLIDRGPEQLETVRIVRAMVAAGSAEIVMGNHEFNAIAYATVNPTTLDYCRPHTDKNTGQHRQFLAEAGFDTPVYREIIDWFLHMPLWLEVDGLRIVHACWSERHLDVLRRELGGPLLDTRAVIEGKRKDTPLYDALEVVLKGPEVDLGGASYDDKEGNKRRHARLRWWDPSAATLADAIMIPGSSTFRTEAGEVLAGPPTRPLAASDRIESDPSRPVLFGHYWWNKDTAEPFLPNAACLDYSVAAGGPLVAYRWNSGDDQLRADRLIEV